MCVWSMHACLEQKKDENLQRVNTWKWFMEQKERERITSLFFFKGSSMYSAQGADTGYVYDLVFCDVVGVPHNRKGPFTYNMMIISRFSKLDFALRAGPGVVWIEEEQGERQQNGTESRLSERTTRGTREHYQEDTQQMENRH